MKAEVVAIVSVVVAIVFGLVAWFQARQRRPELMLIHDVVPLGVDLAPTGLEVSWEGTPLTEPHLARLRVRNIGRADLTSTMFDDRRPITVMVTGARFVTVTEEMVDPAWKYEVVNSSRIALTFGPDLVKPGESQVIFLLVSGRPTFEWTSYLQNVKTRTMSASDAQSFGYTRSDRIERRFSVGFAGFIAIVVLINLLMVVIGLLMAIF